MSFDTNSTHDLGCAARNAGEYLGYAIWRKNLERARYWTNVIIEIQNEIERRENLGVGRVKNKVQPYDNFDVGRKYDGNYDNGRVSYE